MLQVCAEAACHQHFSEQGRQWLEVRFQRLRGPPAEGDPSLLLDIFDVDQYGCLLVDVRGVHVEQTTTMLQHWTLAKECLRAGWAHSMPWHMIPAVVREALQSAITNRAGAWDLETDERRFQGKYI